MQRASWIRSSCALMFLSIAGSVGGRVCAQPCQEHWSEEFCEREHLHAFAAATFDNGQGWSTAFRFLQDALAASQPGSGVAEVRVAQGWYRPDEGANQTPGDRHATFQLITNVAVMGGHGGLIHPNPDYRDVEHLETTLEGDLGAVYAYHVVTGSGVSASAVLDGFYLVHGNANGSSAPDDSGGGMLNVGGSPTIVNCFFLFNSGGWGGGMLNYGGAPTVIDCSFTNNTATARGGGMGNEFADPILIGCAFRYNDAQWGGGLYAYESDPIIDQCLFQGNSAWAHGGGGVELAYSSGLVTECTFDDNGANTGGGLYNFWAEPIVSGCVFIDNIAASQGGGMASECPGTVEVADCRFFDNSAVLGGGMRNYMVSPHVTACLFFGNSASGEGGGMENRFHCHATIADCQFLANSAGGGGGGIGNIDHVNLTINRSIFEDNCATWGGAVLSVQSSGGDITAARFRANSGTYHGGALYLESGSSPSIVNCLFSRNFVGSGGYGSSVVCHIGADAALVNCTISRGQSAWPNPGAVAAWSSSVALVNSVVYWNDGQQLRTVDGGIFDASYSCIQGGWPGPGNISENPLFVNLDDEDYALLPASPCIDAADNTAVPPGIAVDLAGAPRFIDDPDTPDTGIGPPPIVDMGGLEFQAAQSSPDLNGDGVIDVLDMLLLLAEWGPCPPGSCPADLNGDGAVDVLDLLILLAHWS